MPDRDLECDARAVAEAKKVSLRDLQLAQQRGGIIRRTFERDRPTAIGRAPVALLFERDDSPRAGEKREQSAEVRINRRASAVKEYEGRPVVAAVNFVVDVDAVHEHSFRGGVHISHTN